MPPENSQNPPDDFSQIVDRLRSANNVMVTVSKSPSVDQLSACIGLTLALNKLDKHATAVFSGKVPSTLEFLKPETTIEKNIDSLRDFIISLDKSKADKLRYKVEDNVVKIFITPYRTSITKKDLNFTQGDFNMEVVVALGVKDRADLDTVIEAHGRILHDATVISVNTTGQSQIGSINWQEPEASSLCEMVTDLVSGIDETLIDSQIATALQTGLVAETDRFGNEKVSPHTMSISGKLMSAGASNQLIANELNQPGVSAKKPSKGKQEKSKDNEKPQKTEEKLDEKREDSPKLILEPPQEGGRLTTSPQYDDQQSAPDPFSKPNPSTQSDINEPDDEPSDMPPVGPPDTTAAQAEEEIPPVEASSPVPPPPPTDSVRDVVDQLAESADNYAPKPAPGLVDPEDLKLGPDIGHQDENPLEVEDPSDNKPPSNTPPPPVPPPLPPPVPGV